MAKPKATKKPAKKSAPARKAAAKKPAAKKPAAKKPAAKQPAAKKPAAKKPVAKKPVAKKAAATAPKKAVAKAAYDPDKDRRALDVLIGRHGEPEAIEIEAFAELIDDAGRAKLGNQTKAVGVFRDGVDWAATISSAFSSCEAALVGHYSVDRFRYLLHCLRSLDAALLAEGATRSDQGDVKAETQSREMMAREARADLLAKLVTYAGAREPERAALAEAIGTTEDFTALGTSIEALARLGRFWLGREDKKSRIVARAAGLSEMVVDRALSAAEALTGAATVATLAGRLRGIDSPAVNIAEGSVLFEMMEAERCFERARTRSPVVPKLLAGAATRHVLGPKTAPKKDAPAEEPPQEG
jgi:hypothetical protein